MILLQTRKNLQKYLVTKSDVCNRPQGKNLQAMLRPNALYVALITCYHFKTMTLTIDRD